jgi:hypothetical protein
VCKLISISCKNLLLRQARVALRNGNKFDIIISNNHLSYFLNIEPVIEKLSKKFSVALFIEKDDAKSARLELSRYFPDCEVIDVNHRLLPYFFCDVHLSSIAGKERYFSRSLQKIFYFHGTANLAGFKKNGMAAYDVILCATQTQLLEVGILYSGKPAWLVGYPKLSPIDLDTPKVMLNSNFSVIYCPSYRGILNSIQLLQLFDHKNVLKSLLENKVIEKLIIRPHPQDVIEANINALIAEFSDNAKVEFDYTENYHISYKESDVLVTDFSGTAVSYALIYGKPAICVLKNIDFLKEMQPYALEVCKISFNLDDLENPDYLKDTSILVSNNILDLRKLHLNAVKEFILVVEKYLNNA